MIGIRIFLAFLFFALASGRPQDLESEARALRPADTSPLREAVLDDLESRARAALDAIPRAHRRREIEAQRDHLRQRLEESLGSRRPPWPPDLRATTSGDLEREGYRIEKIVFQTLPGTWVPAHLYLPSDLSAPAPAVLLAGGHWWEEGKSHPDVQAFSINMARMGFVVLGFDPMGHGERGVSPSDHRLAETLLVGVSQQGLVQYEARCALEYLRSREEVDPERIGMTGANGGGFTTWITAALDDEVKVIVTVDDTSDFYEQIQYLRSVDEYEADDHCSLVQGIIQYANNHELLAMVASRPLLIVKGSHDELYPLAGARSVHEYGEEVYAALGESKRIAFVEDENHGRGYQKTKREAAYGWFLRWLMQRGKGKPVSEPDTEAEPSDSLELACFPKGHIEPAGPGILSLVGRLANDTAVEGKALHSGLLGEPVQKGKFGIGLQPNPVHRIFFLPQPGIYIPALVLRPGPTGVAPANGVLVAVDDRGKEELVSDPIIREAVARRHWMVWAIDPRGIGELESPKMGWIFGTSVLLGENFVWRQAWDIQRILERAVDFPSHRVGLYTRGPNASLAGAYALAMARPQPEFAVFRENFTSFGEIRQRKLSQERSSSDPGQSAAGFGEEILPHYFPFDVLEAGDLRRFLAAGRVSQFIIDPINSDLNAMSPERLRSILPPSAKIFTVDQFLAAEW